MLKNISSILIFVILVSACEKTPVKEGGGKFGMLDSNLAEFAAIGFFEHIYNSQDLEGAIKLSTPKMERLLRSYHNIRGVQRYVLNMQFDKVAIESKSRSAGRDEFAKKAQISLFFEGELNGNILKDIRLIELIKIGDSWKVDEVSAN
jgi:hypothetical protein